VPDAEELSLRAQAQREAAALMQRQAAQIDHGVVPVPPTTNGFTPEPAPEDYERDPYDGRRR
jgi:hypothetical protein